MQKNNQPYLLQFIYYSTGGEDGYIRVAQHNPHDTTNSWGLFGILAEGVAPLQAFNHTEQVEDEPQFLHRVDKTWEIVLFAIAMVVLVLIAGACVYRFFCKKTCGKKNTAEEP